MANALDGPGSSGDRADRAGHPERTVFSRFITPVDAREMPGMWQRYYTRWRIATQACVNPGLLELMPELRRYSPPATVIDKTRYSAFSGSALWRHLQDRDADGGKPIV